MIIVSEKYYIYFLYYSQRFGIISLEVCYNSLVYLLELVLSLQNYYKVQIMFIQQKFINLVISSLRQIYNQCLSWNLPTCLNCKIYYCDYWVICEPLYASIPMSIQFSFVVPNVFFPFELVGRRSMRVSLGIWIRQGLQILKIQHIHVWKLQIIHKI